MGMGRVWAKKFEFGETPIFGKNVFEFWGKLTPKMHAHLRIHPNPSSLHAVEDWGLFYLHIFGLCVCVHLHDFWILGIFLTIICPRLETSL